MIKSAFLIFSFSISFPFLTHASDYCSRSVTSFSGASSVGHLVALPGTFELAIRRAADEAGVQISLNKKVGLLDTTINYTVQVSDDEVATFKDKFSFYFRRL